MSAAVTSVPAVPVARPVSAALAGATAVIVGGSSGIGLAAANLLHGHDARVVLIGRDEARLAAAAGQVRAAGGSGEVLTAAADSGDEASLQRAFDRLDRVDHVFVTAAAVTVGSVQSGERSQLAVAVDSRLWGAYAVTRVAAPVLGAGGSITLTSGTYVDRPLPGTALVAAGLGAVEAFVAGLAVELAPQRIRVNAVRPGPVDTPMLRAALGHGQDIHAAAADAAIAGVGAGLPLGRVATAEEAAAAAVFLMTNNYVTGSVLRVDGGVSLV